MVAPSAQGCTLGTCSTEPWNQEPWFVYLAFTTPHAGAVGSTAENDVPVPRVSQNKYANESWPSVEKDFASAITIVD